MGTSLVSPLILSFLFVAVLITARVILSSGELMDDAMREANRIEGERAKTAISISATDAPNVFRCDTKVQVTLDNVGKVDIVDFHGMDVFTWYTPESGDPLTQSFTYTTGNLAEGQWTLQSLSPNNNLRWESNETAVLALRFLQPPNADTSGYVTVAAPNGVSDSDYVSFGNVVSSDCLFLHNNPTPPMMDTASQAVLPMDHEMPSAVPQLTTLYNFDTNRDGDPGLLLVKSSNGLSETNPIKFQIWRTGVLSSPLAINGDVLVDLWASLSPPNPQEIGVILAYLRDFDGVGYTEIANGAVYARDWQSGSASFVERIALISNLDYTVPAGHELELRVIVDENSGQDMLLAYDIATFTAVLNLSFVAPVSTTSFYFHNNPTPPTEDTGPQAVLPLDATGPTATTLYNYNLPGNKPGLELVGTTLGLSDPTNFQLWRTGPLASPLSIDGDVFIEIWAAIRQFQIGRSGAVSAYLRDYDGTGAYAEIGNGSIFAEDWQEGSGTFLKRTIMMPDVSYTVPAGHELEIRLVVDTIKASKDMWFAYDTATYPSVLMLP